MKLYGDYPQTFGRVKSVLDNPSRYACSIERHRGTDYSLAWWIAMALIAVITVVGVMVTA